LSGIRKTILRAGLETLFFSGAHLMMQPFVSGVGVILTFHHVRPARGDAFQPNRLLEVAPDFFADLIEALRRSDYDLVPLDEVHRRLTQGDFRRRFVSITFDDGYRDLLQHAYPVLRRHAVPFALYVPTGFPDRIGELWWVALERVIARNVRIVLAMDGESKTFECGTTPEKNATFDAVYWWLRGLKTETELRAAVHDLCSRYGVDMAAICDELCMDWEEIARLASDPLMTIGAHTVNHPMLQKLPDRLARAEMEMSRGVIEAALGLRPEHFCYPVGDVTSAGPREFTIAAELGYKTAVTTQPGVLFRGHDQHLTALPRISVNGEFQQMRYMRVLMSGAATAVWNGFRRVKAA
jgi:peptidoglycan/xylan/chitin deacetylase (PgdA/CDA1 family)